VGGGRGEELTDSSVKTGKWSDGEQRVVETDGAREVSDDEMTRSKV